MYHARGRLVGASTCVCRIVFSPFCAPHHACPLLWHTVLHTCRADGKPCLAQRHGMFGTERAPRSTAGPETGALVCVSTNTRSAVVTEKRCLKPRTWHKGDTRQTLAVHLPWAPGVTENLRVCSTIRHGAGKPFQQVQDEVVARGRCRCKPIREKLRVICLPLHLMVLQVLRSKYCHAPLGGGNEA